MSHIASYWAINQTGISSIAKLVLMVLADYHNLETGGCFPSKLVLAEKCCCTERTIINATQELALAGMISLVGRFDESGRQKSNQYVLNVNMKVQFLSEGEQNSLGRVNETTPLEPVIYNQDTIPLELDDPVLSIFENHSPPKAQNKVFWDEAVGMMMAMGVAKVTAGPFIGRCLKLANQDQEEVMRILEAALSAGVTDPIPYMSAALGGKKKKEKVVKNKQIADAFAELEAASERRKAQWAEELGEDYAGGGGKEDHGMLQPEPHIKPAPVPKKRSNSAAKVSPRRTAQIVRPVKRDISESEISTDDSRLGWGSE